jgi:hypothetical protein
LSREEVKDDYDPQLTDEERRFFELVHPASGIKGLVWGRPHLREQDVEAQPGECYACIFFPKVDKLGPARVTLHDIRATASRTAEGALARFKDNHVNDEHPWESYVDAGWKVRKIRLVDAGDPE